MGSIEIQDRADFFGGETHALTTDSVIASSPFDVHLLAEVAPSFEALEDDAHRAVTGAHVLAIAIDPMHHKIVVRFGDATGVKAGDFDSIAKAGNAHLRAHELREAIDAIVTRAQASAQSRTAISVSSEPVVIERGLSAGGWLMIALLVAGVAGLAIWLWRRNRRDRADFERALDDARAESAEARAHNAREQAWEDSIEQTQPSGRPPAPQPRRASPSAPPPPPPPSPRGPAAGYVPSAPATAAPTTVVVNQQSTTRDDGSGVLRDMLLIDAIESRPRVVEREVVREERVVERPRVSDDSGGSSSSWDSGSSSSYDSGSSSYDSGGSSSSWDSGGGGGFDSGGGGGFDSGGGSSGW